MIRRWWRLGAALILVVVTGAGLHFAKAGADGTGPALSRSAATAVLFIGDSYTAGPDTPEQSYGCLAAARLRWTCAVSAQPGTGYLMGGPGHRIHIAGYDEPSTSLVERLSQLRDTDRIDIVVLDGGRNDMDFDMTDVTQAFASTVRQVIDAWPDSRIVVIAPWFVDQPVLRPAALGGRSIGAEFASVLHASPEFADVTLIDPGALGWFADGDVSKYLSDDRIHPNVAGEARIADLLTQALIGDGVASPS